MTRTAAPPETATERTVPIPRVHTYLHGLDLLRVICALAVVYNHVAGWSRMHDGDFWPATLVEGGLVASLRLNELLGFVGVGSFLLISGLVVTHVTFAESPGQFLARRATRLFPALWVAVSIAWVLMLAGATGAGARPDAGEWLLNLVLLNYDFDGVTQILPVSWTMTVQVVFYLFVAATIPLLRRWPWLPPTIAAALISALISFTGGPSGDAMTHWRIVATFLPVLFLGQLVMLVRKGKLAVPVALLLGVLHVSLGVRAVATWPDTPNGTAWVRTLALLLLVLLLCTKANGRVARSRPVAYIAARTYAIYLLHFPILLGALNLLDPALGFWPALLIGLVVLVAAVELLYRFVERPIAAAYRRWEGRREQRRRELAQFWDR
ncbi:acyltransferase family protein [Amycolatopsis suaedae]|uniref:Acyltransferase n=1 Tax=Amycolatopsis suaedae TaxID=2510978 RepID=A0A4Q7J3Q8_9PSEU|nr:acyltransferase [Amycolatopsis suaedae]RZQ62140.1 acyltransferase [Amycolatopsis suaedae]